MSLEQYLAEQGNIINIGLVLLSEDWQVLGMGVFQCPRRNIDENME